MEKLSKDQAALLLSEAERKNPGTWASHCVVTANCASVIARLCPNMDADKAYVMGLLHDIGRRFGVSGLRHIIDGYHYLEHLGYKMYSGICMTHSFPFQDIRSYSGEFDCDDTQLEEIKDYLNKTKYNDYDKLIQLCDALAYPSGPVIIEKRLVDVCLRHGFNDFTLEKWREFLKLKEYFDMKTGCDIYTLIGI